MLHTKTLFPHHLEKFGFASSFGFAFKKRCGQAREPLAARAALRLPAPRPWRPSFLLPPSRSPSTPLFLLPPSSAGSAVSPGPRAPRGACRSRPARGARPSPRLSASTFLFFSSEDKSIFLIDVFPFCVILCSQLSLLILHILDSTIVHTNDVLNNIQGGVVNHNYSISVVSID